MLDWLCLIEYANACEFILSISNDRAALASLEVHLVRQTMLVSLQHVINLESFWLIPIWDCSIIKINIFNKELWTFITTNYRRIFISFRTLIMNKEYLLRYVCEKKKTSLNGMIGKISNKKVMNYMIVDRNMNICYFSSICRLSDLACQSIDAARMSNSVLANAGQPLNILD